MEEVMKQISLLRLKQMRVAEKLENLPEVVTPRGTSFVFNNFSTMRPLGESGLDGQTEN
jgi:hypothetical protein